MREHLNALPDLCSTYVCFLCIEHCFKQKCSNHFAANSPDSVFVLSIQSEKNIYMLEYS